MATASEKEEVAELDRVLTRLALTEETNLQKVLTRLLPLALERLGSPHQASRSKVLEMLSHINKRVKGHAAIALPLADLVALYQKPGAAPMTRNFALVYVEMAAARATPEQRLAVVPALLAGVAGKPQQQRDMLLRLAFAGLCPLGGPKAPRQGGAEDEAAFAAQYGFLAVAADRAAFLDFGLKLLLYAPALSPPPAASAAAAASNAAAPSAPAGAIQPNAAAAAAAPGKVAPPGLSLADLQRIEGKAPPKGEELTLQRLALLNFTAAAALPADQVLLHYLVAACDSADAAGRVAARGEALLRKRCGVDSSKPAVDLEDAALVKRLFALFLGSAAPGAAATDATVAPASPAVQAKLMGLFCRSLAAANAFPQTLQVIFACVYGEGTTLRLKQAGMEFAVWVFKHASDAQLAPMAPAVLQGLLRLLDSEAPGDVAGRGLRSFTYQAVGQLATRAPQLLAGDVSIAARFFQALTTEPPGVRAAVQEAVSSLAAAYKGCSGEGAEKVQQLLLDSIAASEDGRRLAAVHWAGKLYAFGHVPARYIGVLAAGDAKLEVRDAGLASLQPPKAPKGCEADDSEVAAAHPAPQDVIAFVTARHRRLAGGADASETLVLPPGAFAALISFLRACRKVQDSSSQQQAPEAELSAFSGLLEHALVRDATPALQLTALEALLEAAGAAPAAFATRYGSRLPWLRGFLSHTDAAAREAAAKLCGVAAAGQPGPAIAQLLSELAAVFLGPAAAAAGGGGSGAKSRGKAARFEDRDGATAAAGYVLAQTLTGKPDVAAEAQQTAATALHSALSDADSQLAAAAAAAALGHAALRRTLPLPEGTTSAPAKPAAKGSTAEPAASGSSSVQQPANGAVHMDTDDTAKAAPDTAADSSGAHEAGGGAASEAAATQWSVLEKITALTQDRNNKVVIRAVTAIGHLASSAADEAQLSTAVDALFALSTNKAEEVQFAVGEALCFVFGGVPVLADTVLRSDYRGLAAWLAAAGADAAAPLAAQGSGVAGQAAAAEPQPMAEDSPAPAVQPGSAARAAVRERILTKVMDELIFHARTEVRCGACIALLSLVSYTGGHPALRPRLPDIQEAFSGLLGDSNEVTQEMASRGISAVYAMSDEAARKQLLDGLVSTLQGGPRKRRAVKVEGDTRVFAEGALPSAPGGGALTTYRELCGLANDLGQPDLVYKFMNLANHAAALNSSRGAAFGFASIAKLAGEQLAPYVPPLVPKLYRFQYDPNPKVREAMGAIWRALVPEPRAAVDAHWDAIAGELLCEMGGRLWRNREAAALGLADLLQGRRWGEVAKRFPDMWAMALRALDDVKESVRAAAVTLARALRGLTLRIADRAQSSEADAAAAVAVALPLLLEKGLSSTVPEVAGLAVDTVAQMVRTAGPAAVRPHLPLLVGSLLESLSTLEDSRLNYIEQHAGRLGLDNTKLEGARFSAAKASPMGDALDAASSYVDQASLEALVPRLAGIVKRGVGANTRIGAARFVSGLALRMGPDIRPSSGALIKALVGASRAERSATAQRAFAAAAAAVARHAPDARVAKLLGEAAEMYTQPGDRDARLLAGLLCKEVARGAGDAFAKHAAQVLPLAFVAKSDEEKDVAEVWRDVWEDATSGTPAALRLYIADIVPLITAGLGSQQWGRKRCCALAAAAASEAAPDAVGPYSSTLAAALQAELPGRLWDGKEVVPTSLAAVLASCHGAFDEAGAAAAVAALAAAAGRKQTAFRKAALQALQKVLASFPCQDHFAAVAPLLLTALGSRTDGQPAAQPASDHAVPAGNAAAPGDVQTQLPVAEAVAALAAAWAGARADTCGAHGAEVAAALAATLSSEHPWAARLEAMGAAKAYLTKLSRLGGAASGTVSQLQPQHLPWAAQLLPGLLAGTEEAKVSAVRAAAVTALQTLLNGTRNGIDLPEEQRAAIKQRLSAMATSERNAALAAQAAAAVGSMT